MEGDFLGQQNYIFYNGGSFMVVYPNPTIGSISIEIKDLDQLKYYDSSGQLKSISASPKIVIYNSKGGLQFKMTGVKNNQIKKLDISHLPTDTYNLILRDGEIVLQSEIVKI